MRYSISLNFEYLSMKMNWAKRIFEWEKWNFKLIGSSADTTEFSASRNALLATITFAIFWDFLDDWANEMSEIQVKRTVIISNKLV